LGPRLDDRAAQAGMRIEVATASRDELVAAGDPAAIEQVLFNLVDNACKYAAGASDRRIHVEAALEGERAIIRVRDHGPGVGAEEKRRLFSPFSKSAQRAASSAPGVGLGLALSRRLARAMKGDLRMERT